MAEYTKNYNLEKQQGNDNISIEGLNENFDKIDTALGNSSRFEKASGTGTAITLSGIILEDGASKTFIVSANNNGAATTINGKKLYKPGTTTAPSLIAAKAVTVWYDFSGDCFFIKASAEGNAIAENVLAGKTFSNDNDTGIEGTMTNRSGTEHAAAETYATQGFVLLRPPKGYYDGNPGSVVRWDDPNFKSANIRGGVNIFGVAGNSNVVDTSDGTIDGAKILTGYGGYSKGVKVNGTMPNRGAVSQSLPINGNYTIPAGYHNGSGKVTQSVSTQNAQTYTPGTADQTIAAGQYLSGAQTIKGEPKLLPGNIPADMNFFGVQGIRALGKKFASGTTVSSNTEELFKTSSGDDSKGFIRMSSLNLTFVPRIIYYYDTSQPDYYVCIYVRDGVGGSVYGIKFVVTSLFTRSYSASNPHEYLFAPSGFNKNYAWFAWE